MKLRITLVKPPEISNLDFGSFSLAVLAAYVRNTSGCTLIDATNLSIPESAKDITNTVPDIVGITTMGWSSVKPTGKLIKKLRACGYGGLIIAGGHGATILPSPLLEAGADAVVVGEGELTFRDIAQNGISEDVRGLALWKNKTVFFTPERPLIRSLDSLPLPAYDLMGTKNGGFIPLETSRGCPHRCTFCETSVFFRNTWRAFSPEIVAQNIRILVENYGATLIHIVDDNFTADPLRALRICKLIQNGPLPLCFFFAARSDDLLRCPELIPALASARFLRVNVGVETLDVNLAEDIRKPISFNIHKRAFGVLRKAGIYTYASFIMGLPGETKEARKNCVDMAVKLGVDAAYFLPFIPLPGTPLARNNPQPEPRTIIEAKEATRAFKIRPGVINRLLKTSRESSIRGLLARESLHLQLKANLFDPATAKTVKKILEKI